MLQNKQLIIMLINIFYSIYIGKVIKYPKQKNKKDNNITSA